MPVAVVGMHRSGTSMVAQMLGAAGLHLGLAEELLPASADNPDGYWEHAGFHRLNESVLAELGGGWDLPPLVPERWRDRPEVEQYAADAQRLIGGFKGKEPWGWKDPRTCLTFGLWRELIPDLKAVICVRNPLEVALSLNRRGMFSYTTGLELWRTYNERILATTTVEHRIITNYDAFFTRPKAELRRILSFLEITPPTGALNVATAVPRQPLRHTRFDFEQLREAQVADDIVELYSWLTGQASRKKAARAEPSRPARTSARVVDERAVEAEMARRAVIGYVAQIDSLRQVVRDQEQALSEARRRAAELAAEVELLREHTAPQAELLRRLDDVQTSFYALEAAVGPEPTTDDAAAAYVRQLRRIKEIVRRETPPGAAPAVVSKGDERLLGFYGRRGKHFPQTEDGAFAGGLWASGLSAVAHLEVARARGATHFLLPAMQLWWLEYYHELRRHLNGRYRQVVWDSEACVLYDLWGPPDERTRWRRATVELVSALRSELGRTPRVLDLSSGLELADALPASEIVARPFESVPLPYPDQSIDIVALRQGDPAALEDARRVASAAVIGLPPGGSPNGTPSLLLSAGAEARDIKAVSIVGCCQGDPAQIETFLRSLEETLPPGFKGEIVLVDITADDRTTTLLKTFAAAGERRTAIGAAGVDPLRAVGQGTDAASEELLIFLGSALLLLPGWLRPLLDLLRERPDAGVVGGRLVSPAGSLEAAGGTVFNDGSLLSFGAGEADPAAALFEHVRKVDFCSPHFLATPRRVLDEAGGLDASATGLRDAVVDYCFTLRRLGLAAYYQPASTAVQLGSSTAQAGGLHPSVVRKWRAALKRQPARPELLDNSTLHALAAAPAGR